MDVLPITLEGRYVRLVPLTSEHLPALMEIGMNPDLWQWTANSVTQESDLERYVHDAIAAQSAGTALPFTTIELESGCVVGSTRFGNIDKQNRKAEIGWTWIDPRWQRSAINTEAKLLMLEHAFESWRCIRVELKTDALNVRSRKAILRIGATQEGILRNHMITESGRFRDSVYFSIIESEWPSVREKLTAFLKHR